MTHHVIDLSDLDNLDDNLNDILDFSSSSKNNLPPFEKAILINNAGSLGHLGPCMNITSLKELQTSLDFNITSSLWVSTRFVRSFSQQQQQQQQQTKTVVVNISSLCAIEPFKTMGVYCTGKAARDMFHTVLAKETTTTEEEEGNNIKVLNYAPGALETEMADELINCNVLDKDLHNFYVTSKKDKTAIMPQDSADLLLTVLMNDDFESGSHIDYWDLK